MKKNYIILLFGILLMLAGCKKDNPDGIPEGALLLTTEGFVGPGGAKTSVNGTSVQWDNGDQVLIRDTVRTVTVNTERTRAYVAEFEKPESGDYYGYYPHDLTVGTINADATTVVVPSHYECHYSGGRQVIKLPLIGKAHCTDDVIRFRHVTAAVKLDIKNTTGVPVVLDSVVVSSATQQLSGSCGVTISVGGLTVNAPQTTSTPANRKVKVTFTDSPEIATNAIKEVQIPILPIAARTDDDFTISIYTHANIAGAAPGTRYIFSHAGTNDALARNEMMTAKIALSDGGSTHPTGLIPVNPQGKKVIFSQANLKYQATTHKWRFHDYQWDYIGSAPGNTTAEANRSTQSDWIDLFGWGTGTLEKAIMVSGSAGDYTSYDEWGVNAIENGGNTANFGWRTLTSEEWNYVLNTRGTQNTPRYAPVKIAGFHQGLIIFPDDYSLSLADITTDGHDLIVNTPSTVYTDNELSLDTWREMEAAGAVFLPAAGYRGDNTVNPYNPTGVLGAGQEGVYWSSSASNNGDAYRLLISNSNMGDNVATNTTPRYFGYAVRLVMDVVPGQSN